MPAIFTTEVGLMRSFVAPRWWSVPLLWVLMALPVAHGRAAGDGPLVSAARDNDEQAVRTLIADRADVDDAAADGSTALLWAAYHANVGMAQALLAAGAEPDAPNGFGVTPLLQASRAGDARLVGTLLEAGADATRAYVDSETPLMAAARAGRPDAVRLLLEAGSDPNGTDQYQRQTPLMWAAAEGHAAVIEVLLGAGGDPDVQARRTTLEERKHADHPTGGFTPLMFAVRNGHGAAARALLAGEADPSLVNGDGVTAMTVAILNDRFDLAAELLEHGADADDGSSLYFAVDMHDATTDMRAHDGSRLRADHPNRLSALDLVRLLLDGGADPNRPFVGQIHNTTLCCAPEVNSSPVFRAAQAADVEALRLLIAHGADVDWTPAEIETPEEEGGGGRGMNANVGKTPVMLAMVGGRGAPFAAGPGFERLSAPPFREPSNRAPADAVQLLLDAGADPNAGAPDGSTPLHQAVQARQVAIIRSLVAAGARLDAVNGDNLTPLLLAEKPEPPPPPGNNTDARAYRPPRNTREEVIAAVRDLLGRGADDPAPVPPPAPEAGSPGAEADRAGEDAPAGEGDPPTPAPVGAVGA
jgi:cytohesin